MIRLWVLVFLQVVAPIDFPAVKNASLDGSDEVDGEEDVVSQLVTGPEAEIYPTTRQSCHEIHKHNPAQDEKSCGGEDEHPRAHMLQDMPEEVSQYHDDTGNNTLDEILQPDVSTATTGRGVTEPAEDNGVIHGNSDSDYLSQAEKSCCREDEHRRACMLQNMPEEVSQYHDDTGNNTLDQVLRVNVKQYVLKNNMMAQSYVRQQPDLSAATTGRGVTEPTENNGVIHGNSDSHYPSQAEKSCGREDEHPRAHMLQNMHEEVNQYHHDTGNNILDQILQQPDLFASSTGRGVIEPADNNGVIHGNSNSREGRETEAEEEMKSTTKFCYLSTGISAAGIISIFSGYLGDQTGHARTVPLKVCTMFTLTTFVSGAIMLVLIFLRRSICISIEYFRSLKYTTFGFLVLSMFSVSVLFLKMLAILAFIPTLFMVMISCIMVWHPCSHHQGQRGMSYRNLSPPV